MTQNFNSLILAGCFLVAFSASRSRGLCEDTLALPGIARFTDRAELTFGVTGKIESICVREGDRVHQGQLLATLANDTAVALVEEATAKANARGALRVAETEHKAASLALDAVNRSKALIDESFTEQRQTMLRLDAERTRESVNAQREQLEIAAQAMRVAEMQLRTLSMQAPFSGTIVRKFKTCGEGVDPVAPVLELVNADEIRVEFFIPEAQITQFRLDQRVFIQPVQREIESAGNHEPQHQSVARIGFVDLSIQSVRRVVRAWVELRRPEWMMEGMQVEVKLIESSKDPDDREKRTLLDGRNTPIILAN